LSKLTKISVSDAWISIPTPCSVQLITLLAGSSGTLPNFVKVPSTSGYNIFSKKFTISFDVTFLRDVTTKSADIEAQTIVRWLTSTHPFFLVTTVVTESLGMQQSQMTISQL